MDDREKDKIDELTRTVNLISQDVATIKAIQPNLAETLKSFTTLYTTLDTRVRNIEVAGHECKNTQMLQQFMTFMIESKGVKKGQKPLWDSFRSGITSIIVGVVMLVLGFLAGGGK